MTLAVAETASRQSPHPDDWGRLSRWLLTRPLPVAPAPIGYCGRNHRFVLCFHIEQSLQPHLSLAHTRQPLAPAVPKILNAGLASRPTNDEKAWPTQTKHPAACPPRTVFPVNTRTWFGEVVSTQHVQIVFGKGCDQSSYVCLNIPTHAAVTISESKTQESGAGVERFKVSEKNGAKSRHQGAAIKLTRWRVGREALVEHQRTVSVN